MYGHNEVYLLQTILTLLLHVLVLVLVHAAVRRGLHIHAQLAVRVFAFLWRNLFECVSIEARPAVIQLATHKESFISSAYDHAVTVDQEQEQCKIQRNTHIGIVVVIVNLKTKVKFVS
jgi:hypothetical protein